jgi:TolA-binding protein
MRILIVAVCCLGLAACGKPSAEESFAAAEKTQRAAEASFEVSQSFQDSLFNAAIELYEQVIENHPDNPIAEVALFRTAELYNNGLRNFPQAISTFRRYLEMYPGKPQAPVCLFMMGFLYANELHQLDSASAVYKRFLDSYAEHELSESARAELDNLGKSPAEIIEQRVALSNEIEGTAPGDPVKKRQP